MWVRTIPAYPFTSPPCTLSFSIFYFSAFPFRTGFIYFLLFHPFPFYQVLLSIFFVFTIPYSPLCNLCMFSHIFASRWLDTLQTWRELLSHWFDNLKELPGISFWVRYFKFHAHAFQLLLFIDLELSLYLSLQFLMLVLIFAFCFPLFPDCCENLIRYPIPFLLRLDASDRYSGYFQQDSLGTLPLSRDLMGLPHHVQPPVP